MSIDTSASEQIRRDSIREASASEEVLRNRISDGVFLLRLIFENARKVAMYLVPRCCDRKLPDIAECFGTNGYASLELPGLRV